MNFTKLEMYKPRQYTAVGVTDAQMVYNTKHEFKFSWYLRKWVCLVCPDRGVSAVTTYIGAPGLPGSRSFHGNYVNKCAWSARVADFPR
jgi:hypothetical protein